MSSFTIRFEGSLSLQDRDENGSRSVLIQNLRIYLPEEIERGLVPPVLTAPSVQSVSTEPIIKQESPFEVQEKQEEVQQRNEVILTPYSVITDDDEDKDDDTSQLTFQWSWSHTTPPSKPKSKIAPNAPIKENSFDFSSLTSFLTPNKPISKNVPDAPIKSNLPMYSVYTSTVTSAPLAQQSSTMTTVSSSSSSGLTTTSSSSVNHKPSEELFLSYLKQFHMIPDENPSRNPQNKQKDYHHFMFWHHFKHSGYSCENSEECMKEYIYEVITSCCLTENEDHDRQRCYTLQQIMKKKGLSFNPICDYYTNYKNYLSLNENQHWRYNLNRYKLMEKFIKETY